MGYVQLHIFANTLFPGANHTIINAQYALQNCINQFTTLAKTEQCRFIGNVGLGRDVSLAQLRPYYHAVVMVSILYYTHSLYHHMLVCLLKAYGAEDDRVLGIPGEVRSINALF